MEDFALDSTELQFSVNLFLHSGEAILNLQHSDHPSQVCSLTESILHAIIQVINKDITQDKL